MRDNGGWQCKKDEHKKPYCAEICGDSLIRGNEECDVASEGCVQCKVLPGWECDAHGCNPICGDGKIIPNETCDTGFLQDSSLASEGCHFCSQLKGWNCLYEPSICSEIYNDGIIVGS